MPIPKFPGMEFLDDVDRILISSPGQGIGAPASGPSGDANPDTTPSLIPEEPVLETSVLLVVMGISIWQRSSRPWSSTGPSPRYSIQVYRPQGKSAKDMAFVPLEAQTILIGDSTSIFASLEHNQFAPRPPAAGSVLARAAEMDANYEVWVLVSTAEMLGGDRLAAMFSGGDWGSDARGFDGFEAGLSFRNGLAADVVVRFASEAVAKKLASEMARLMKMASKDKAGEPVVQGKETQVYDRRFYRPDQPTPDRSGTGEERRRSPRPTSVRSPRQLPRESARHSRRPGQRLWPISGRW